jgi:hypothetical protein
LYDIIQAEERGNIMDYYTLSQIILALRDEYKKNELLLEDLKKYTILPDFKTIDDIEYYGYNDGNKYYLELSLNARQNAIMQTLTNIYNKIVGNTKKVFPISKQYNNDKRYMVFPDYHTQYLNEINFMLHHKVDEVLGTKFSRHIATDAIFESDSNLDIKFNQSGITSHVDYLFDAYPPAGIIYRGKDDSMIVTAYEEFLYLDSFNNIINAKIKKSSLPLYHQSIIDKHKNKELLVEGLSITRASQHFEFDDVEENTVLLRRKK